MRATRTAWAMLAAALLLAGCGGGEDRTKANLRFVNASPGYAALDLAVDDALRFDAVAYGQGPGYVEVDPASSATRVSAAGSATPLASLTPSLVKRQHYTVLAYGRTGALQAVVLDDNASEPDSGKAMLRVLNAAADAGSVDVYLTAAGDSLAGAVPTQSAAAPGVTGAFVTIDSGTWRLRVTGAGDKSDLRLDRSDIVLDNRQVTTLVLTPATGGVLVDALLLAQRGEITARATQHARLRVAAGLPDAGLVAVDVAGQRVFGAVGSPAVGPYQLVLAGDQTVGVTADGVRLADRVRRFDAGTEHTLLVHDDGSGARASWIDDDNRPATGTGLARIRLVHGVAGGTGDLSMTLDGLPVAVGVMAGTASAPVTVSAAAALGLNVTATGVATPVFSAVDRTLLAGAVYSVFVLGAPSAVDGVLRKDR